MKTFAKAVVPAVISALLFAGCGSKETGPRPAAKGAAAAPAKGAGAPLPEIRIDSPALVLENASVAAVKHLAGDRRGDTLIKTDQGSRYYVAVGNASPIKVGDRVIVRPIPDGNQISLSVNNSTTYSGRIAK